MEDVEPLEPVIWFHSIRKMLERGDAVSADALEMLLRHGFHLLQLTPRPLRETIGAEVSEAEFERLLTAKAFESAAERLVSPPLAYALRRPRVGLYEAEVRLPGETGATLAQGPSFALALLRAWGTCLLALEERAATLASARPRDRHTRRGERHLRLIEH